MEMAKGLGKRAFKQFIEWLFKKISDRKKSEPLTPAEEKKVSQIVEATFADVEQFGGNTQRVIRSAKGVPGRKRVKKMPGTGIAVRGRKRPLAVTKKKAAKKVSARKR